MLVYTRWDYVDRDTNIAHHIWICYPDGRDPRRFHGNYPAPPEGRPVDGDEHSRDSRTRTSSSPRPAPTTATPSARWC